MDHFFRGAKNTTNTAMSATGGQQQSMSANALAMQENSANNEKVDFLEEMRK